MSRSEYICTSVIDFQPCHQESSATHSYHLTESSQAVNTVLHNWYQQANTSSTGSIFWCGRRQVSFILYSIFSSRTGLSILSEIPQMTKNLDYYLMDRMLSGLRQHIPL
ncbi:unnamed protein product, partial [Heterobilharzia americana]